MRSQDRSLTSTSNYKLDTEAFAFVYDPRTWIWGCGGLTGLSGHHGMFDCSKALRVPRATSQRAQSSWPSSSGLTGISTAPTAPWPVFERRAYVCPECFNKGNPTRIFLHPHEPGPPKCPIHAIKMIRQRNRPYVRPERR